MLEERRRVRYVMHDGPFTFRPLEVLHAERLTKRMVRVTLGGPEIQQMVSMGADDDIRIQFPVDFDETPLPPVVHFQPFKLVYPENAPPSEIRAYTIRRLDRAAGELDIDFVIHGDGIATRWAEQAKPAQRVTVGGPRGSHFLDGDFTSYLFLGDETAMPAIGRHLEELAGPASVTAIIEVEDGADEQSWATAPGVELELRWIHRNGAAPGRNDLLATAVRELPPPVASSYVFGAGESSTIRELRRFVVNEWGLDRRQIHFAGYWKRSDDDLDYYYDGEDDPDARES